jgi:Small metal-binding protein
MDGDEAMIFALEFGEGKLFFTFSRGWTMRVLSLITRLSVALLCMGLMAGCASYSTGNKNSHVAEAVTHAQEAIDHGGMGHADVATDHAKSAVMHLKEMYGMTPTTGGYY